jgi:hypothetical protein
MRYLHYLVLTSGVTNVVLSVVFSIASEFILSLLLFSFGIFLIWISFVIKKKKTAP